MIKCVEARVFDSDNQELTKPFLKEEFKHALLNMNSDKASRPDGFNPMFYKRFWNLCGVRSGFKLMCFGFRIVVFPQSQ